MARFCARQSFFWNFLFVSEDELVRVALEAVSINDSGTSSYTPAISYILTPILIPFSAPIKFVAKYIDITLQKITKLTLELFVQGSHQV